jgi:aspartate-semialdehyde dehydrogenase
MLPFGDDAVEVEALGDAEFSDVDLALFSAGSSVSETHAPRAAEQGATVIDNTSAFRMDDDVPLVVPEVNGHLLDGLDTDAGTIIANPNCSTIQMVVALKPLHDAWGLQRVVVSTYQSASGAGQAGVDQLVAELRDWAERGGGAEDRPDRGGGAFQHPLAFDALPWIGSADPSGFTTEELKMVHETRKIMDTPSLSVAAHCVRVPAVRSHSESLTVDFERPASIDEAREAFARAPGLRVHDDPASDAYPTSRLAEGNNNTWVGRLRRDLENPETLHFWVVSDNLRKGAAWNSIQIAEHLFT